MLIVNAYFDESRRRVALPGKVPQSLAPVFLAGWFHPARWDIRLHNEHAQGPLESAAVLGWPDMLVMTGLTISLDRMRHLTAYARTMNPTVLIVAGGHAVRAFPRFARSFLDVACQGDVEEMREVIIDHFGPEYANDVMTPRYDLAPWMGRIAYAESTRYCNFRCSFCTLTGEKRAYRPHSAANFRRQLEAMGKRSFVAVLDNNFYGNDRRSFAERVDVMKEAWEAKRFRAWSTLVTGDFFLRAGNIERLTEAGCVAVFSGVESFDPSWNESQNKRQNLGSSPVQLIRSSLERGLVVTYGLILDLYRRRLADLREEMEYVLSRDDITAPTFMCLPTMYPGTPHFYEMLEQGRFVPGTRVRDLDTTTISAGPVDGLGEAAEFVRRLQTVRGHRRQLARHSVGFLRRYRGTLTRDQLLFAVGGAWVLAAPFLVPPARRVSRLESRRSHVSATDPLDPMYRPAFRVDARFQSYFEPTVIIAPDGQLGPHVAEDVDAARAGVARVAGT